MRSEETLTNTIARIHDNCKTPLWLLQQVAQMITTAKKKANDYYSKENRLLRQKAHMMI